ncbi:transcriptional regulator SdiA [Cedecea sp. FDAARGOS_727]|uniref:transcriptional regulator SdiA n=1 Tax=Cedecea sp. FDAARGOS_727 TaxID=2545798 RepID=UPI00143E63B5|nr:transcriptional regulator SdiA [Cedecea sp. FDAARGOS_727]QIX98473.1 transcriptional regulator SdiA [Cedecea sp. FDAARGOS_727]
MLDRDFFSWRRDMLEQFLSITQASELQTLVQRQTQQLEFDYFSLCVRHPVPFTRPKLSLQSSYPQKWLDCYVSENYFAVDPVLKQASFIRGEIIWSDALFADARDLWDAARDHGLASGRSLCVMAPNRAAGFFSVSRTSIRSELMPDDELGLRLNYLAELSLSTMARLEDPALEMLEMKLSKREREILQWTGEGKTSAEIAIILSISENTVNFHQKNMQKKFNAPNKTQIACYAAAMGII